MPAPKRATLRPIVAAVRYAIYIAATSKPTAKQDATGRRNITANAGTGGADAVTTDGRVVEYKTSPAGVV